MKRVLIVEDDDHLRRVLRTLLEAEGFEVAEAADGLAGMEAAGSSPPDCILTDTLMPRLGGLDMLARLAKAGCGAPAILVSAVHQLPPREELLRLGVREAFGKPFAFDALVEAVRRIMEGEDSKR
jgi:DNA-binding response OmpR family regulator